MVAIYVRQSLDKKDSLSIDAQIEDCISLCQRYGWDDYKIYRDKGWSAKNLERPAFKQLNKDVEAGLIETVICYKIDRISRSIRDLVNLIYDYSEIGVHFVSFADNINTAAPGGMMMATMFGSLAQMEREAIITRVTDNYYFRCEQGYWGGGPAPYGYSLRKIKENGQTHTVLEQNEREASVVTRFYEWYNEPGGSVYTILKQADEAGIMTRQGKSWTARVITDILTRPLYAPNDMDIYNYYNNKGVQLRLSPEQCDGTLSVNLFGKRDRYSRTPKRTRPAEEMVLAIAKHKPIVSSELFLRTQYKKENRLSQPPRTGTGKGSILSGFIKCAACGRAVSTSGSRNGVRYFVCSGKKNYAHGTCTARSVKVATVEQLVRDDLLKHIEETDEIQTLLTTSKQRISPKDAARINSLKQDCASLDIEIENLLDAITTGSAVANEYFNKRLEVLDKKKRKLLNEIEQINRSASQFYDAFKNIDLQNVDKILESGSFEEQKAVCSAFINKITMSSKEDICIEYII